MQTKTQLWIKSLIGAIIGGAANAILASLGIAGANAVGIGIKPLDFSQLGGVCVSGAIVGLALYLKQSPVPPEEKE